MKTYRVHVHDHADGRWLAQADFIGRPDRERIEATMPVLNEPGRYEVRVCLVQGGSEMIAGNWLQGEPWFRENDGWSIKGYGADPGWHVTDVTLRETPRERIEKLYSLGQAGGLPQLPDEAWVTPACETCGCQPGELVRDENGEPVRELIERDRGGRYARPRYGFVRCNHEGTETNA